MNNNLIHVYPIGDLKEHITDKGVDCWCRPDLKNGVITHNALDRRELYEEKIQ